MIRGELTYRTTLDYGDPVFVYMPAAPFEVDGIVYTPKPFLYLHRPMIERFRDHPGYIGGAFQCLSSPPTEKELDAWVAGERLL